MKENKRRVGITLEVGRGGVKQIWVVDPIGVGVTKSCTSEKEHFKGLEVFKERYFLSPKLVK
jgi:hypothetical protein